ncbi:DUF5344 family protein [Bacillus sp. SJS]|uniref:DUF5344 family protein n=1 Tax=Bacillus sp. SJS TaxID=1423321 RepID=UPI0004DCE044|nr:DUF5344 family protein [Bacillus sp. SJS]KZZ84136.1 hypothetical protein AS29_013160 [Bacillus sp. SJS]
MANEIKVKLEEVYKSLDQLNKTAEGLSFKTISLKGDNVLNMAQKMDQLNKDINLLTEEYKSLLKVNLQLTKQSVNELDNADKDVASFYK